MEKNRSFQPLPDIFVSKSTINDRVTNYQSVKYPLLDAALKSINSHRQETKSIWYTKAHIESIVAEMDLTGADGVRIYFGAYGESESPAPGQLCLMMVLTRSGELGSGQTDIIYENETDFEDRSNAGSRSRTAGETEEPRQFNYGSPCPPICVVDPAYPQD